MSIKLEILQCKKPVLLNLILQKVTISYHKWIGANIYLNIPAYINTINQSPVKQTAVLKYHHKLV